MFVATVQSFRSIEGRKVSVTGSVLLLYICDQAWAFKRVIFMQCQAGKLITAGGLLRATSFFSPLLLGLPWAGFEPMTAQMSSNLPLERLRLQKFNIPFF